ncbi:MAG: glycosyltransferase family 4 protein [Microcoleaceae cyanobacterium]
MTTGKNLQTSTLNICIVTPYYATKNCVNSGIANHFYELAHGLIQLGHEVHILFSTEQELTEDDILIDNAEGTPGKLYLHPIHVDLPNWVEQFFKGKWAQHLLIKKLWAILYTQKILNQIVKKHQIEVIETISYDSLCLTYLFQVNHKPVFTRVATTLAQINRDHYEFSSKAVAWIAWLERWMIHFSDHLVTHTLAHRDEVCKDFRINQKRFEIIPHGIKLPQINITLAESQGSSSCLNILYVGRFEYRKGTDILLEAIPSVLNQRNNIYFTLVGKDPDDSYQRNFKEKWQEKFDENVSFAGAVNLETLHQLYKECDIFVAPSRYESFGLIYVEAMSYEKPVIGCKAGGIPEVIDDGVTGFLAEPNNPQDLATKILQLANDAELRYQMGQQGRHRAEKLFSREQMAKKTIENYYQLS